jgi:alkylation response protein AidB-like acyl-CoA dehydrogenase
MTTTVAADVALTSDVFALVADRAAASDESGHLDPEVVAELAAAGINRLMLPAELGGLAVSPRRTVEVVERLAAVDGSTAWVAAIGFGTSVFAGYLPPDGAAEVFADPDQSNAAKRCLRQAWSLPGSRGDRTAARDAAGRCAFHAFHRLICARASAASARKTRCSAASAAANSKR